MPLRRPLTTAIKTSHALRDLIGEFFVSKNEASLLFFTLLASSPIPNLAVANDVLPPPDAETIVVTASRREQNIQDVQASVEVVSRAQIEATAGGTLIQSLAQAVGVDARTAGATSSITIRGSTSSDVLVLFDGLPRTSKYGITNLNNFPVEDVERIEIVRGPMSALYGADASGGVVNVITKAPGVGPAATVRTTWSAQDNGDRAGLGLAATFRLGDEALGHRISVDFRNADPFRFLETNPNFDLIGIKHFSATYNGGAKLANGNKWRWTLEAFDQNDTSPAFLAPALPARPQGQGYTRFEREQRFYAALDHVRALGAGTLDLNASFSTSDGSTNRSFPSIETTKFDQFLAQGRWSVEMGQHNLLVGGGFQRDELAVSINGAKASRDNYNAYIQNEWALTDAITVLAGVRYDDFTLFGSTTNPRASIGWKGQSGLFARIGYGTAFRAPTSLEQFSRFTRGRFIILGSPDLVPEESKTEELVAGWRGKIGSVEAVWHRSEITNLVETFSPAVPPINGLIVTQYRNRASADIEGLEIIGRLRPMQALLLDASWEQLDVTDGITGARLNGRYENALKASATLVLGRFEATLRYRGLMGLWGPNPAIRGSAPFATDYELTDLIVKTRITDKLDLTIGLNNLGDELTPVNYTSTGNGDDPAGRNFFVTLRANF